MTDEALDIQLEPFAAHVVAGTDYVVGVAKKNGSKSHVQTSKDLQTLRAIFDVWTRMYPAYYEEFMKGIRWFRKNEGAHGIGGDKNARIQHQLEVPQKLYEMIMAIFPDQDWDRPFIKKLVQAIPEVKVIDDTF